MYEHRCANAGAEGCAWSTTANSVEELKAKLDAHVNNYLRKVARK